MSLDKRKSGVPLKEVKRQARHFTDPAFCELADQPGPVARRVQRFVIYDRAAMLPNREGLTEENSDHWVVWENWHYGAVLQKSCKRRQHHLWVVKDLIRRLRYE